jgi:hypothetical protein
VKDFSVIASGAKQSMPQRADRSIASSLALLAMTTSTNVANWIELNEAGDK